MVKDYESIYDDCRAVLQEDDHQEIGFFASLVPKMPNARVLDVGCAEGVLVRRLMKEGHDATGLDISPRFPGCVKWDIEAGVPDIGQFDYIFANNILEHFRAPSVAMTNMRELLRDGGRLFINTPNAGWWRYWVKSLYPQKRVVNFRLDSALHLQEYTHVSAQRMLAFVGLPVVKFHGGIFALIGRELTMECKKAEPLDCEKMVHLWSKL